MSRKPLRIWTSVWGDKHIDLFERALVPSLSWPINRDALVGAKWEIWTRQQDFVDVLDIARAVGIDVAVHNIDPYLADLPIKYLNDSGVMTNQLFLNSARRCLDTNSQMLIAPPDTVFSGEALPNILHAGDQEGTVVFVAHIRVVPEILSHLPPHSMSNASLVTLAMKYAHKSWTEAELGHERINTHVGGIFWKRRPGGTYAVSHALPTPYLINWTEDDYSFFSRQNPPGEWPPVFGEIDHTYPSACAYRQGRARLIGSSDDAFIVEITDADANVPELKHYDPAIPDLFWRGALHNMINRQFVITFRGEDG